MNTIQAPARVTVTKGPWYKRNRYLMELWVGDIHTGLHWHLNRKEARTFPKIALDSAAELLEVNGLMESVYLRHAKLEQMRALAAIPAKGSKVKLTAELTKDLPVGSIGTVTQVDTDAHHTYPITVAFVVNDKPVELPVELSEVEVA